MEQSERPFTSLLMSRWQISSSDDKKIEIGLSDDATKAITEKLDCLFGKMEELSKSDYVARSINFTKENFSARHPKSIFF